MTGCHLVPAFTNGLRLARRTHPCFGSSTYRPFRAWSGYGRPARDPNPGLAVLWYRFLKTGYGRPARPGRILVPVFTDQIRTARPTEPPDTDSPPDPAVFWYPFLQTGYGQPADPAVFWYTFLQTKYGRPARPGRILVPVLPDRIRPGPVDPAVLGLKPLSRDLIACNVRILLSVPSTSFAYLGNLRGLRLGVGTAANNHSQDSFNGRFTVKLQKQGYESTTGSMVISNVVLKHLSRRDGGDVFSTAWTVHFLRQIFLHVTLTFTMVILLLTKPSVAVYTTK
ncbi:hypothetical protein BC829DRAFT_417829 [Chytridium lagenaria]|nr:hypothetical protein BC829DRAFT_417829 [Chytridium lagenaria]